MATISGTITSGYSITDPILTITPTGYVNAGTNGTYGAAVYSGPLPHILIDQGRIRAAGTVVGVGLSGPGSQFTNASTGTITAAADAVFVQAGGVPVYNSGTIVSTGASGINSPVFVFVTNTGTGLISGYGAGIRASRATVSNSGTITATATATAIAATGAGIVLSTGANSGSLNNSGMVSGAYTGVSVYNGTIDNTGTIKNAGTHLSSAGAGDSGIRVTGNATITNTGTAALISAYVNGIYGLDGSTLSVSNSGTIKSNANATPYGSYAIFALGGLTVTNNGVMTSRKYTVDGHGNDNHITNTGTITGGPAAVIIQRQGTILGEGTVANNGGVMVGYAGVNIADLGTVTNTGTISGTFNLSGIILGGGGYISNASSGIIQGADRGATVSGAAGTVVNAGTITGQAGLSFGDFANTVIDSGTIAGTNGTAISFGTANDLLKFTPSTSVKIQGTVDGGAGTNKLEFASAASAGTLTGVGAVFTNFTNGTIDSGASWVLAGTNTIASGTTLTNSGTLTDTGTLVNAGSIGVSNTLSSSAVGVFASGQVNNTASGRISGFTGVRVQSGGSLANAGSIVGYRYGILAGNNTTITNTGSIAGAGALGQGVYANYSNATATIINGAIGSTAAYISGSRIGIQGSGANSNFTVVNYGTVKAGAAGFAAVAVDGASRGTIINGASGATGALMSGNRAAYIQTGTILNYGTLQGGVGAYLRGNGAATVINGASGSTAALITGSLGVYERFNIFRATVVNFGTIFGTNFGVTLIGGGTVRNHGTIQGNNGTAVVLGGSTNNLTLYAGSTLAGVATAAGSGNVLELGSSGTAGTISGLGTSFSGFGTINVDSGAQWTITGSNTIASGTTLTNSGTLTDAGSLSNIGTVNGNLTLASGAYLNNTGKILATSGAGIVATGAATIINSGTIDPPGPGVYLMAGGPLTNTNAGYIGGGAYGVKINGTASATITNAGTIAGSKGIYITGTGTAAQTIIDSGTIAGSAGTAIAFGAGNDLLQLIPSTSLNIQGTVDGGGGTNTLELASAASAGTISGIGTKFINFTRGTIDSGASWVFAGSNSLASGTTLTNSGTLTDTGTLTNAGSITGSATTGHHLITLGVGGYLNNVAGGVITATGQGRVITDAAGASVTINNAGSIGNSATSYYAIGLTGTIADTVINSGTITSTVGGIYLTNGTVVNSGLVTGSSGYAVGIGNGYLHNLATGSITAGALVKSGKLVNAGTITDPNGAGIEMTGNNGTVINTGSIRGSFQGALLRGGGTVIDAGTIVGNNGTAVSFGTVGNNNLLKLYPGAVLTGIATAGGTGNVLELASAGTAGTISGLGTSFRGFGTTEIDSGAQWTITGSNSIANGTTLTNSGTLIDTGLLTNSGSIIGSGVFIIDPTTFTNTGYIGLATTLAGSGDVLINTSTGTIKAASYVVLGTGAAPTVSNAGTIEGIGAGSTGIYFQSGGSVANTGSTALISGGGGIRIAGTAGGTVTNTGTIAASSGFGVYLVSGGSISNGNGTANNGTIAGYSGGIRVGAGTVSSTATINNFGTIESTSTFQGYGVEFYGAGAITNGSTSDTSARITGYAAGLRLGVNSPGSASTVTNFGTIAATGTSGGYGITLGNGGNISNGASNSTAATISGSRYGISDYVGTITNFGSILGGNGGLRLTGSGPSAVINGASNSTAAVISGQQGVYLFGGTLTNFGLIAGNASGTTGLSSYFGVALEADGSVGNFGTIEATGTPSIGITLNNGGTVTNGASNITNALIAGSNDGIDAHFLAGTVTNFGTIIGTSGIGVYFNGSPSNTLIDRGTIIGGTDAVKFNNTGGNLLKLYPGAVLTGIATAAGTGNVLELGSAGTAGTISGLGTSFVGFGTIQVDSGAQWTITNTNSLAGGATLTNSGTLTDSGTLTNSGTVTGTGTLLVTGSLINSGSVSGAVVKSGGSELVAAGGSDLGTRLSGGTQTVFGTTTSDTVFNGGTEIVSSGGTASATTVSSGGVLELFGGATLSAPVLSSGAIIEFGSGYVASGVVIGGGVLAEVLSSGTANSTTVSSGGTEIVSSGGHDFSARISSGGTQTVFGTATSDTVFNGGIEIVSSGGIASATTVSSGGVLELFGGATVSSPVLLSGATIEFGSGYVASGFVVNGGVLAEVLSSGTALSNTIMSGGFEVAFSGGLVSNSTVNSGGSLTLSGGSAVDIRVSSGGSLVVSSGGVFQLLGSDTLTGLTVSSGGTLQVGSGYTLSNYAVGSATTLQVLSRGSAVNTTVSSYGNMVVSGGGFADPTVIYSGGLETISSGGVDSGAQISGGVQYVYGTASGTTLYSGGEVVASGGVVSAPTISGGVMGLLVGGAVSGGITFAGTGTLQIDGTSMPGNTISGFSASDAFFLIDVPFASGGSVHLLPGNLLQITEGGQNYDLQLDPNQDFSGISFQLTAALGGGTVVTETTPCYCAGTLILTDRGEVEVERLAIGDRLITADGAARPIRWIGKRSYAGRFARGSHVLPICIKAGALDIDQPRRDLWISPQHAMFLEGVLIEAIDLVNGVSIVQADRVERVDYFHIELDTHDVIIAEGALSESFVDDDSRGIFQNAHEFAALYPDTPAVRPARYCAPRLALGAQVEAARRGIAQRAGIAYTPASNAKRARALVVDSRVPELGHDGGANAILDHIRGLQAAGFEVSFLALGGDCSDGSALSSLGVLPLPVPESGRFSDFARAHADQFDLVYLHRVETATQCLKLARRYFDAQIIYSVADLHHLRLQAQSAFDPERAADLMDEARHMALQELSAALSADRVITHSVSEAEQLERIPSIGAAGKVRVIPWVVPVAPVQTAFADRSGLAFIGSFAHAPNVDAARWLVREIMPLVWRDAPEVRCLIIGSDLSDELHSELEYPGVDVLGRVDRLGDVFERIRLTVAPLHFGAGLKDKVLRSMAAGLPCVGTAEAFRGMHKLPAAIAGTCQGATAAELAAAIVRMHRNEKINARCAKAGLRYVADFYNQSHVDTLIRSMAQPAFERHRVKMRARLDCTVLEFSGQPRDTELPLAAGLANPVRRVIFS